MVVCGRWAASDQLALVRIVCAGWDTTLWSLLLDAAIELRAENWSEWMKKREKEREKKRVKCKAPD
jgi:hypothetical protein